MQRIRIQAQKESLKREKQTKYIDFAQIRLEHFDFSKSKSDVSDRFNVKNLISIFEDKDCFQQDSWHYVTTIIDQEQLNVVIYFAGISSIVLLDNVEIEQSELQLFLGFRLEYLYNRYRV